MVPEINLLGGNFRVRHRFQSLVMFPHWFRVWIYITPVSSLLSSDSQLLFQA